MIGECVFTQQELFSTDTLTRTDRPSVDNITVPFEWARVSDLMNMPSVDFEGMGLRSSANREYKRSDWHYEELMADIAEQGFLDPIFVYLPHTRQAFDNSVKYLGNGHHRLIAAFDLGYQWVPVTYNPEHKWRHSGIFAQ
jgi:hypothetical protein